MARRRILAGLFFAAGAVWTVGFPKSARLDPDMVLLVALSLALFGTGTLVLLANRIGVGRTVLSISLLVSFLANVCQWSENVAMADLLSKITSTASRHR